AGAQAPPSAAPPAEPSPPAGAILISVAERRLRVVLADGSAQNFPIAVGRSRDLIPLGTTEVLRKRRNPTWVPTPEMRRRDPKLPASVPPGPRNPMGLYALDLGWTYYRIHGTNEPQSIGRAASSGCFRMLPKDIEAVFKLVDVGTKVTVIEGRLPKLPDPAPAPAPETKAL
ncbi:L,D-transpeptidase, partial [Elstera litoralis]|uniref:L,D-transpeptidase n=1 Tax=Elstera litoralis TaxID=552518 RepID=UPI0012EDAA85